MMSDDQICQMLEMHRFLICCEIKQALYQVSQDNNAADLQQQVNARHWNDFAKWLRDIRDE